MRSTENQITFVDMEINRTQEDLKGIHNIRKMQSKGTSWINLGVEENIDNNELKQKIADYQIETKEFKNKSREMEKKSKKREQEFKKQQAYLVALETKRRKYQAEEELDVSSLPKGHSVNKEDFMQLK